MKLEVISIHNEGGFNDEYVDFAVVDSCDLVFFMIADTTYKSQGKISNQVRHTFWFPSTAVQKGDFVRVYTRPKRSTDKDSWTNTKQTTTHLFYWGLHVAVWNDTGDACVLFDLDGWKTTRVS